MLTMLLTFTALAGPPSGCTVPAIEPGFHPDRADQIALAVVDNVAPNTGATSASVLLATKGDVQTTLQLPPPRSCGDLWPLEDGDLVVLVVSEGYARVELGSRVLSGDQVPFPFVGPGEPLTDAAWRAAAGRRSQPVKNTMATR